MNDRSLRLISSIVRGYCLKGTGVAKYISLQKYNSFFESGMRGSGCEIARVCKNVPLDLPQLSVCSCSPETFLRVVQTGAREQGRGEAEEQLANIFLSTLLRRAIFSETEKRATRH